METIVCHLQLHFKEDLKPLGRALPPHVQWDLTSSLPTCLRAITLWCWAVRNQVIHARSREPVLPPKGLPACIESQNCACTKLQEKYLKSKHLGPKLLL